MGMFFLFCRYLVINHLSVFGQIRNWALWWHYIIHPLGTVNNIITYFFLNPSSTCWDIPLSKINVDLLAALGEHQSHWDSSSGDKIAKFHGNPSNSWRDISAWAKAVEPPTNIGMAGAASPDVSGLGGSVVSTRASQPEGQKLKA